jgi:hypothetical protein
MRKDTLDYLESKEKLKQFVRENPNWYRKLTRNPQDIKSVELAAKNYFKQTIPYKVEKISDSIQFASMMMEMYKAMNKGD